MPAISIIAADGEVFSFDAVDSYRRGASIDLTDHTMELGSDVTEHAQVRPKPFAFRGVVTESPYAKQSSTGGLARVQAAIAFLDRIAGQPVSVVSEVYGTMENMFLTRYDGTRGRLRELAFDIELRAVRFAEAGLVTIAPSTPATTSAASNLPDQQDLGEQPTSSTGTEPAKEEADKSNLLNLSEGMGYQWG